MTTAATFAAGVGLWTAGLWWLIAASERRIKGDT